MMLDPRSSTPTLEADAKPWDQMAEGWHESAVYIRPWLRQATDAMLNMAGIQPGHHVLDVAAGAGDQTLDVAERIGADGYVLATDLSAHMLACAEKRAADAGYRNVGIRVCNGQDLGVGPGQFDAAVCRLGLLFFQDPLQGLREIARALKPGGGVCTVVFSRPDRNPCITTMMSAIFELAGLPPRDPYQPGGLLSLGKPGLVDDLFRKAGFEQIATTAVSAPFRLPSVRDYMTFIRTSAGPIHQLLQGLPASQREAIWAEAERRLGRFSTESGWEGPNELLLTAARRPINA
jgi:SAM-dependent methyltransferase